MLVKELTAELKNMPELAEVVVTTDGPYPLRVQKIRHSPADSWWAREHVELIAE